MKWIPSASSGLENERRSHDPGNAVAFKAGDGPQLIASKKPQTVLQPLGTSFRQHHNGQRCIFFFIASEKDAALLTS